MLAPLLGRKPNPPAGRLAHLPPPQSEGLAKPYRSRGEVRLGLPIVRIPGPMRPGRAGNGQAIAYLCETIPREAVLRRARTHGLSPNPVEKL